MDKRFAISDIEMAQLDPEDFKLTRLSEFYLTKLLHHANELGLKGMRINDIYSIRELFGGCPRTVIDFTVSTERTEGAK